MTCCWDLPAVHGIPTVTQHRSHRYREMFTWSYGSLWTFTFSISLIRKLQLTLEMLHTPVNLNYTIHICSSSDLYHPVGLHPHEMQIVRVCWWWPWHESMSAHAFIQRLGISPVHVGRLAYTKVCSRLKAVACGSTRSTYRWQRFIWTVWNPTRLHTETVNSMDWSLWRYLTQLRGDAEA